MPTDPAQPATCIPPNNEVSGWWWLTDLFVDNSQTIAWWRAPSDWLDSYGRVFSCRTMALRGFRILGPVPTHAEVEALRSELNAANAEIERIKKQIADAAHVIEDRNKALRGCLDRLAGVANPDLVTVRREDLREVLWAFVNAGWQSSSSASFRKEEAAVNARITAMEDATR